MSAEKNIELKLKLIDQDTEKRLDNIIRLVKNLEQAGKAAGNNNTAATKQTSESQKQYTNELNRAKVATEQAKKEQIEYKTALMRSKAETDSQLRSNKELANSYKNLGDQTKQIRDHFKDASGTVNVFGKSLTALASITSLTAILATLTKIVQVGAEFQHQMNIVAVVAKANYEQAKQLQEQAQQLGSSTIFTNTEVAKSQAELAKKGFEVTQVLKSMPGVVALASATQTDLVTSANIAAGTMKTFGIEMDKSREVADKLTVAVNESSLDIVGLGDSLKYVAKPAKESNQSLDETLKILMLLSDQMIDSSTAGTSLRQIFMRLQSPTREVKEALKELKVATSDLYDDGKLKPLSEVFDILSVKLADYNDKSRIAFAEKVAGQEGVTTFLTLLNAEKESLDKIDKSLKNYNGTAQKTSDAINKDLAGSWQNLTGEAENFAGALTNTLTPALKSVNNLLSDMLKLGRETGGILSNFNEINNDFMNHGKNPYIVPRGSGFDLKRYEEIRKASDNTDIYQEITRKGKVTVPKKDSDFSRSTDKPKKETPAFINPVSGQMTSGYGMRVNPVTGAYTMHEGIDVAVPTGTKVVSPGKGIITKAGWQGGYGNAVTIDFGNNITSLVAHLSSIAVKTGQAVEQGQTIGLSGSTGRSTGPHTHWEMRKNGKSADPLQMVEDLNKQKKGGITGQGDTISIEEYQKQVREINNRLDEDIDEAISKALVATEEYEDKILKLKEESEERKKELIRSTERTEIEKLNHVTVIEAEASQDQRKIIEAKHQAAQRLINEDIKDIERSRDIAVKSLETQIQLMQEEHNQKKEKYGDSFGDDEDYYNAVEVLEKEKQLLILQGIALVDQKKTEAHQNEIDRINEEKEHHIQAMQDVADGVRDAFSIIGDAIGGNLGQIIDNLGGQIETLMNAISKGSNATTGDKVKAGAGVLGSLIGSFKSGGSSGIGGAISGTLGTAMSGATAGTTMKAPGIATVIGGAVGLISGAVSGMFGWLFGRRLKKELKKINNYVNQYNSMIKGNVTAIQKTAETASSAKYIDEIESSQKDVDAQVAKLASEAAQISSNLDPSRFKKKKSKAAAIQKRDELLEQLSQQQQQVASMKKTLEEAKKQRIELIETTKLEMLNNVGELIASNTSDPYSFDIKGYSGQLSRVEQTFQKTLKDFKDSPEIQYLAQRQKEETQKALEFQRKISTIDIAQNKTQTLSDMKVAHLKATGASEAELLKEEKEQAVRDLEAEMLKMREQSRDNQEMLTKITQYEADRRAIIEKESQDEIKEYYKQTSQNLLDLIKQRQNAENMFRFDRQKTQSQQRKEAVGNIDRKIMDLSSATTFDSLIAGMNSEDLGTFNSFYNNNRQLFAGLKTPTTANSGVMAPINSVGDLVNSMMQVATVEPPSIPASVSNPIIPVPATAVSPANPVSTANDLIAKVLAEYQKQQKARPQQAWMMNRQLKPGLGQINQTLNIAIQNPGSANIPAIASQLSQATYNALQQTLKNQQAFAHA